MSSEPPKTNAVPPIEPFKKGKITWGRPPQPVFQVGPLPRAAGPAPVAPAAAPPQAAPRPNILTGSLIPAARPVEQAPRVETAPPAEPETGFDPFALSEEEDAAPAPLPIVEDVQTEAVASPPVEPAVVSPVFVQAPVARATSAPAAGSRSWAMLAGGVALLVVIGAVWLSLRPSSESAQPAPAVLAESPVIQPAIPAPAPPTAVTASSDPEPATETAPADVPAAPTTRPDATPPPTPPVRQAAPLVVVPSPPVPTPSPRIETAPLVVQPPTAATPAPSDPDAPIATRPQPLN
ncbi:MAG: hypothetical protein V4701_07055 [Pseudomonadota bacterium]